MPLTKSEGTIAQLGVLDEYFNTAGVVCWEKPSAGMKIYIFSMLYNTVEELRAGFTSLRDHIAISFQSQTLQSDAERWNLYLFILIKEPVPDDLKQHIVQDKFSTRKIVYSPVENDMTEEGIGRLIEQELFGAITNKRQASAGSLTDLLVTAHPLVADALTKFDYMNNRELLQPLVKVLCNE
jgi:hypothetical protein